MPTDNNDKYEIKADSGGYYIRGDFTSSTLWNWENKEFTGTPEPNYFVEQGGHLHGSSDSRFVLSGSATAEVYAGGSAEYIEIKDGGSITISGGKIIDLTVSNGGKFDIGYNNKFAEGDLIGATVLAGGSMGSLYSAANENPATLIGSHYLSAGVLSIKAGATTSNLFINSFGSVNVNNNGNANSCVISGGNMTVLDGGSANGTKINAGTLTVSEGGTTLSATITRGIAKVQGKGKANNTKILTNGQEQVNGGQTTNTIISGGSQIVTKNGQVIGTKIRGGQLDITSGTASKVHISAGKMVNSGKGSSTGTQISKGLMSVTGSKSLTSNTVISKGASQHLYGSIDSKATIYGLQDLSWNAKAYAATVKKGGKQFIHSGLAQNTTVNAGGILSSLAKTSNTTIEASGKAFIISQARDYKAKIYGLQYVNDNALTHLATIFKGGSQIVSNATTSNTIISQGGKQIVSGWGGVYKTTVDNKGILEVQQGAAYGTTIAKGGKLTVFKQGSVDSQVIQNGGVLTVNNGGTLNSATINSGGKVEVKAGGTTVSLNAKKGAILTGGTAKSKISLAHDLILAGNVNAKNFHAITTKVGGLKLKVAGNNNTLGSFKDNVDATYLQVSETYRTRLTYDISAAKTGTNMLSLSTISKLRCYCTIQTAKKQRLGTYKLSKGLNLSFGKMASDPNGITIKVGSTSISAKTGQTVKKNGMQYKLSLSNNQFNLSLGLVNGVMRKGTSKKDTLTGTANSDIFYGGQNNDQITGKNGRDVAVYDKTAWGQDKIGKTSGTMTLVFKDLKATDIKTALKNDTLTVTRKSDAKQTITVQGWSNSTHNIVYANGMTAFNQYLAATNPSQSQLTAARNEVFKKAGLATK